MGRVCKREKKGKELGRDKYLAKRMSRVCKRKKKGKNWGEINIKPKEWGENVRERRNKKTRAR